MLNAGAGIIGRTCQGGKGCGSGERGGPRGCPQCIRVEQQRHRPQLLQPLQRRRLQRRVARLQQQRLERAVQQLLQAAPAGSRAEQRVGLGQGRVLRQRTVLHPLQLPAAGVCRRGGWQRLQAAASMPQPKVCTRQQGCLGQRLQRALGAGASAGNAAGAAAGARSRRERPGKHEQREECKESGAGAGGGAGTLGGAGSRWRGGGRGGLRCWRRPLSRGG